MPNPGTLTTYDHSLAAPLNLDEVVFWLGRLDAPLINGVGMDGISPLSVVPTDSIKFETMFDSLLHPRSTLAATAVTAATEIVIASGHQTRFSTGDYIRLIKAGAMETVKVTGYSATTADTLLVTRATLSTTAAQFVTGVDVVGVGQGLPEASVPEAARHNDMTTAANYTQIFGPTLISQSGSEQVIQHYGVSGPGGWWAREVWQRTQENIQHREQAFLYGLASNTTSTRVRTTAGLLAQHTTNVDTTSTQLTITNISANLANVDARGGAVAFLMANPLALSDLNDMGNTSMVRTEMTETARGRARVKYLMTEYGDISILRNRYLNKLHAIGFNPEYARRRVLRPLMLEQLAKTGDFDSAQIVVEEGLQVKGEQYGFVMNGLTAY